MSTSSSRTPARTCGVRASQCSRIWRGFRGSSLRASPRAAAAAVRSGPRLARPRRAPAPPVPARLARRAAPARPQAPLARAARRALAARQAGPRRAEGRAWPRARRPRPGATRYRRHVAEKILVGTSSWADPGFVEEWYPKGLPARDRLEWYAARFPVVEVNSSFYAIPERETVGRWARVTPEHFVFDVKLHKLLSRHSAQIKELPPEVRDGVEVNQRGRVRLTPELQKEMVERTKDAVEPLERTGKLGAFLLQLTPAFSPDKHELAELDPIIEGFAPKPVAVEFRHRGWVRDKRIEQTLDYLSDRGAVFVSVDAPPEDHI